jgi:hypothetical protein
MPQINKDDFELSFTRAGKNVVVINSVDQLLSHLRRMKQERAIIVIPQLLAVQFWPDSYVDLNYNMSKAVYFRPPSLYVGYVNENNQQLFIKDAKVLCNCLEKLKELDALSKMKEARNKKKRNLTALAKLGKVKNLLVAVNFFETENSDVKINDNNITIRLGRRSLKVRKTASDDDLLKCAEILLTLDKISVPVYIQ